MRPTALPLAIAFAGLAVAGCHKTSSTDSPDSGTPPPIRFAAMGDFGVDNADEAAVAALIKSWHPDFVLSLGDNNYPNGEASTIDANVGKYYAEFIGGYAGAFGPGSPTNRFFATLGNHDWHYITKPPELTAKPYLDYFTLPGDGFTSSSGNERYYDFVWGPVHFFALDGCLHEPHGRKAGSLQAAWLVTALAASRAASASRWNIVFFHQSPYSSEIEEGGASDMRWPFRQWGADLVLTGHDHAYERLFYDGMTFVVSGNGGAALRPFGPPVPGSLVRNNESHGALLIEADTKSLRVEFHAAAEGVDGGKLIDCVALGAGACPPTQF